MGLIPLRIKIKVKRILYLQYILKQKEGALIKNFLKAQIENPMKNEWYSTVKNDMKEIEIQGDLETLENITVNKLKKDLNTKAEALAVKHLNNKLSTSKGEPLKITKIKMANYLKEDNPNPNIDNKRSIFKVRW